MASGSLTTISNILKTQYLPPIREQLWTAHPLLERVKRDMKSIQGDGSAVVPIHVGRNLGVGARAESAALPTAGSQSYLKATVPTRYVYGRINVTGPSIAMSRNNKGAFASIITTEVNGMVSDLKHYVSQQLYGNGSGVLGLVEGSQADTSFAFDNLYVPYSIQEGMVINVVEAANGEGGDPDSADIGFTLTAVSYAAGTSSDAAGTSGTATASATVTCADNSFITMNGIGSDGVASGGIEMMGLRGIVSNADPYSYTAPASVNRTLQGIDRDSYEIWKANVDSSTEGIGGSAGTALTVARMRKMKTEGERRGANTDLVICGFGGRDIYEALLVTGINYVVPGKTPGGRGDASFQALTFDNVPIIPDTDCRDSRMYFLDSSEFTFYAVDDFNWMEDMSSDGTDQGNVLTKVSGYDQYEAVLYIYGELGVHNCRKQSLLLMAGA